MAGLNRRVALAVIVLSFLVVGLSSSARAAIIIVNTTDGDSEPAPLCSLPDAVAAHNTHTSVNGCPAGSINDVIKFIVTGTIALLDTLEVTSGTLDVFGPTDGCSGAGPCGITLDGRGSVQILIADPATVVTLSSLTLTHGFAVTSVPGTGGGAIFANGIVLEILNSILVDNKAEGSTSSLGGEGGAIFGATGTIEITNSTIANNTAVHGTSIASFGGGIYWTATNPVVTNTTIVGNSADKGGGMYDDTQPSLKSTILANNPGDNCFDVTPKDENYNLSDDSNCFFTAPSSMNGAIGSDLALDPMGPQNNGGPTDTIALRASSKAIGLIPVADCTDQSNIALKTDQRLFARPDPLDLTTCDSGAFEFDGEQPISIVGKAERLQIVRSANPNSDQVNLAVTFTDNGPGTMHLCDDSTNALGGIMLDVFGGTCADLPDNGLELNLSPFVVHTVNHQSYGTLFQQMQSETVSGRIVQLMTPADSCGEWTLNLEVSGLNTPSLGLGGNGPGPFALTLIDNAGNTGCFDINNAVVGNEIPTPTRKVRRRVRR